MLFAVVVVVVAEAAIPTFSYRTLQIGDPGSLICCTHAESVFNIQYSSHTLVRAKIFSVMQVHIRTVRKKTIEDLEQVN